VSKSSLSGKTETEAPRCCEAIFEERPRTDAEGGTARLRCRKNGVAVTVFETCSSYIYIACRAGVSVSNLLAGLEAWLRLPMFMYIMYIMYECSTKRQMVGRNRAFIRMTLTRDGRELERFQWL
jgi:hypothetical protein